MRGAFLRGLGLALGIGLPPALLANLIAQLTDLRPALSGLFTLIVLVAMVVGGREVGRSQVASTPLVAAAVGFTANGLISLLGWSRRTIAGEDVDPLLILVLAFVGALFAALGGLIGFAGAGRTRR